MAQPTQHWDFNTLNKSSTIKALTADKPGMQFSPLSHAFRSSAHARRSRLVVFGLALPAILLGEYLVLYGYTGLGRMAFLLAMCVLLLGAVGDVNGAIGDQYCTGVEWELRKHTVCTVVALEIGCFSFALAGLLGSYGWVCAAAGVFLRGFGAGYMAYGCLIAVRGEAGEIRWY